MFQPGDYCKPTNPSLVGIRPEWIYKVAKVRIPSKRVRGQLLTRQTIYLHGEDGMQRRAEDFEKVVNARTPKI